MPPEFFKKVPDANHFQASEEGAYISRHVKNTFCSNLGGKEREGVKLYLG